MYATFLYIITTSSKLTENSNRWAVRSSNSIAGRARNLTGATNNPPFIVISEPARTQGIPNLTSEIIALLCRGSIWVSDQALVH